MIYIVSDSHQPDFNIAMEEYCFKYMKDQDKIFILWINEPSIIVGKHQNTIEEVNAEYVKEHGIHVVRRISGGGAVYHDLNNLNYTIISNEDKGVEFDFKTFSEPVIQTLAELGVKAEFSGRNDLIIDGKKICGNAQAYIKGRIMHHGCLLFDTDLTVLSKALEAPKHQIKSKSIKSVKSPVDNILPHLPEKISVDEFANRLLEHMIQKFPNMKEYRLNENDLKIIEKNRKEKFGSWEWNYGYSPKYNISIEKRFKAGKIQVMADIENSTIQNIKFYGTFFGNNDEVSQVEEALAGVRYNKKDVRDFLSKISFNDYFAGFSLDELTEAIVD